jgi:hypothetical protein
MVLSAVERHLPDQMNRSGNRRSGGSRLRAAAA